MSEEPCGVLGGDAGERRAERFIAVPPPYARQRGVAFPPQTLRVSARSSGQATASAFRTAKAPGRGRWCGPSCPAPPLAGPSPASAWPSCSGQPRSPRGRAAAKPCACRRFGSSSQTRAKSRLPAPHRAWPAPATCRGRHAARHGRGRSTGRPRANQSQTLRVSAASRSPRRARRLSVSREQPILAAMSALRIAKSPEPTDSHCVPPSRFRSCTVRTARSRSSGENGLPAFCVMALSPHRLKLPGNPERFTG